LFVTFLKIGSFSIDQNAFRSLMVCCCLDTTLQPLDLASTLRSDLSRYTFWIHHLA
jgi:hypothetical protein